VGQSVNNDVRNKNLGFLEKSEMSMIDFYSKHPVKSAVKDVELRNILDVRIKMLLVELLLLPYQDCKQNMNGFMAFVYDKYPNYNGGMLDKIYRFSYPLCWFIYHYMRPAWAYLKVNILKR
jgi:hypothetical protein